MLCFILLLITTLCHSFVHSIPLFWVGGVTSNNAKICLQTSESNINTILVSSKKDLWDENNSQEILIEHNQYGFECTTISNLQPKTTYYYAYKDNNIINIIGNFETFPEEKQLTSFKFGFGSCEKFHEKGYVWNELSNKKADFYVHMGDLFYSDIEENDINLYKDSLYKFLQGKSQRNYLKEHPVVYMFDDHDFSNNNSGGWVRARPAALEFYDKLTPHYDFKQDREDGVYQAFTYGNVRFILTDLRSKSDNQGISTLGNIQKEWLKKELADFKNYSMVIWVSTKPWIGKKKDGIIDDKWYSFPEERQEISNYIAELGINNIVMIAGDAHLLAIDDGSHTDYSNNGGKAGFPIMQSSPMAQYGSSKGGPFSEGCYSFRYYKNYQYAMMYIEDTETKVCFTWNGYIAKKSDPKFKFNRCINKTDPNSSWVIKGTGGEGTCEIKYIPNWLSIIIGIVAFLSLVIICGGLAYLYLRIKNKNGSRAFSIEKLA
ncbi:Metallo-dependent phosphatase [Piromyces finnis]|uniref:Metallo-dependent phosphatase n=1 Tax=Piromyces finnis TaxID=1754191 RepID=A0A1Y1UWE6_9FUNG|nr:Metallo-dependent phosphatase [Piromyces finnis]|eukprot:ORX41811.1 Metallo-dependent phosphatase [Piromyces finnis]